MTYTTFKIAKMTGVTLRTLRYYDKIGLLHPSGHSEGGYRLYSSENLETLQQILFFKELDFPLAKISEMLNSPNFDRETALKMQIDFLDKRVKRYLSLSELARNTLANMKGEREMNEQDLFQGFDYNKMMAGQKQYEEEVTTRWGQGNAYKISKQRTSRYSKEDWERITDLQKTNMQELARCLNEQVPFDDIRVQKLVEDARQHIDKYYYPCSIEMMGELGNMYVSDSRFKKNYDKIVNGLAEYYNQAIQHYCHKNLV